MFRLKTFIFIALLFAFAPAVLAQADCPTIIQDALAAVDSACSARSRNQACYGNIQLQATPREGVTDFQFEQAGDIADVTNIQRLQLSTFSPTDESWGVALMKLQANLPDTLPGQNVTFLLFGEVGIENAVADAPKSTMTVTGNANVRSLPTTRGNNVIASLKKGQEVTATGRLTDNSWVRIKVEGDEGSVGWVSAQFIDGDLDTLMVIEPQAPQLGPMQAFYFKTGSSDRPCEQAPDSGLLVQSSQGARRVAFTADGVDVTLGSTVYLQADDKFMTVSVVEGFATLTASGTTQIVPAGSVVRVPLGADGLALGAPESPQPYDAAALKTLPLGLSIWEAVSVAPALTADEITAAIEALQSPKSGTWRLTLSASSGGSCRSNGGTASVTLTFNDNDTISLHLPTGGTMLLSHVGDTYSGTSSDGIQSFTITFTSPTTFTGQAATNTGNGCNFTQGVSGTSSS